MDSVRTSRAVWQVLAAASIAAGTLPAAASAGDAAPAVENAEAITQAWQTVRQLDCARCHGRGHDGLAAPSVLVFVRSQSRERFDRIVLDGDPPRGMPGYGHLPRVADNIDGIYRYFLLRANGAIGRGQPFTTPGMAQRLDGSESRLPNTGHVPVQNEVKRVKAAGSH
jgi:mono/diheme cytochrome c family protein